MLSSAKCTEDDPETCCICGFEEDLVDTWAEEFNHILEQLEESIPESEEMSKRCLRFLCGICRGKLSDVDQLMEAFEDFPQLNEHNHSTKEEITKQVDDLNSLFVKEEENLHTEEVNVLSIIEIISDDDDVEEVGLSVTTKNQIEKTSLKSKTVINKSTEYNCNFCNKKCKNQYILTRHIDHNHTGEMKFKCDQCPRAFRFNTKLIKHKLWHSRDRPFVCQICSKAYFRQSDLNSHSVVHIKKECLCNVCGKIFKHKNSFEAHLRRYHGRHREKKEFVCEICSCAFYNSNFLKIHMYKHTQNWPFQCDICKKGFAKKYRLIDHMSVHSDEMNYKCNLCKKQLKTKKSLYMHQKNHTQIFTCEICYKKFECKKRLSQHIRVHMGKNIYECDACDEIFAKSSTFLRHKIEVHSLATPFKCGVCFKSFTNLPNLKRHIYPAHPKEAVCKECGKLFKNIEELNEHELTHNMPYQCEICTKCCANKSQLNDHMTIHSDENNYKCTTCKKQFKTKSILQRHKKIHKNRKDSLKEDHLLSHTHTPEKPIPQKHQCDAPTNGNVPKCEICMKVFSKNYNLMRHIKTVHISGKL